MSQTSYSVDDFFNQIEVTPARGEGFPGVDDIDLDGLLDMFG
jgi:hypothetical protein